MLLKLKFKLLKSEGCEELSWKGKVIQPAMCQNCLLHFRCIYKNSDEKILSNKTKSFRILDFNCYCENH